MVEQLKFFLSVLEKWSPENMIVMLALMAVIIALIIVIKLVSRVKH